MNNEKADLLPCPTCGAPCEHSFYSLDSGDELNGYRHIAASPAGVPDRYDVGWKIRGVTAYNRAKARGFKHPECVEAAIKAAPPAPEGDGDWL